jgi:hypothetical protein
MSVIFKYHTHTWMTTNICRLLSRLDVVRIIYGSSCLQKTSFTLPSVGPFLPGGQPPDARGSLRSGLFMSIRTRGSSERSPGGPRGPVRKKALRRNICFPSAHEHTKARVHGGSGGGWPPLRRNICSPSATEHTKARAKRATGGLGGWSPRKKALRRNICSHSAHGHTKARAKRATGCLGVVNILIVARCQAASERDSRY